MNRESIKLKKTNILLCKILLILFIFTLTIPSFAFTQDAATRLQLSNGLVFLVQPTKQNKIVGIEILLKVGLKQETNQISGINNLLAIMLSDQIDNSSATNPYALESLGASCNVKSDLDYVRISCLVNSKNWSKCLEIVANNLNHLDISTQTVDSAKEKALRQIKGQPAVFEALYEIFLENFYRYHPYKMPQTGTASSIKQITPDIVKNFYEELFIPNRMVISIVGDIDKENAVGEINELFGNLPYKKIEYHKIDWEPPSKENEILLTADSTLSWLMIGYPAPSYREPDFLAMQLIYEYLTAGLSSKLWVELREKSGLIYSIEGILPKLDGPSHFIIYLICDPENASKCERIILNEVKNIRENLISNYELEKIKRKFLGSYLLGRETDSDTAFNLAFSEILYLGYSYDQSLLRKINSVTSEDIKRAANNYLDNYTLIVTRPLSYYNNF